MLKTYGIATILYNFVYGKYLNFLIVYKTSHLDFQYFKIYNLYILTLQSYGNSDKYIKH